MFFLCKMGTTKHQSQGAVIRIKSEQVYKDQFWGRNDALVMTNLGKGLVISGVKMGWQGRFHYPLDPYPLHWIPTGCVKADEFCNFSMHSLGFFLS